MGYRIKKLSCIAQNNLNWHRKYTTHSGIIRTLKKIWFLNILKLIKKINQYNIIEE